MAKFVKEDTLNAEIQSLFEEAEEELLIISPFIKLSDRLKDILKRRVADPELEVVLVFGKNPSNKRRSLSNEDFSFFKQFANIKIYYEPRLHAKYYSNEKKAILSSMNLLEYSQNNNIEFGIVTEVAGGLLNIRERIAGDQVDREAYEYFRGLLEYRNPEYHNEAIFKKTMLGLSNKYSHSEVTIDLLTDQLSNAKTPKAAPVEKKKRVTPSKISGYCIRTGEAIPFNIEKPYTDKAFTSWNRFKNEDFSEKYCHYSGEPSEGSTTKAKPILSKNWSKAKRN